MLLVLKAIPKYTEISKELMSKKLKVTVESINSIECQGLDDTCRFVYQVQHYVGTQLMQSTVWIDPFSSADARVSSIRPISKESSNA